MARAGGGTASPVTVKHNSLYAGSYVTFPDAEGSQSRIWVYCTPTGGWYNPVGHPPALWLSETDTPWSGLVEAGFRSLDFGRIRDRAGYKLLRLAHPLDATAVVGRDPRQRENACAWATDVIKRPVHHLRYHNFAGGHIDQALRPHRVAEYKAPRRPPGAATPFTTSNSATATPPRRPLRTSARPRSRPLPGVCVSPRVRKRGCQRRAEAGLASAVASNALRDLRQMQ